MNLLSDPLISVATADGVSRVSLPGVLALVARGDIEAFPRLRAHQTHAWHTLVVQLGALALLNAGVAQPPTCARRWRALLSSLSNDDDRPWHLVAGDPREPAFLQPPTPEGTEPPTFLKPCPDDLDVVVTSRNHGQKSSRLVHAEPEDWVFALTTLQTMSGMMGPGQFPIMRMSAATSARPVVSLTPDPRPGAHMRRDLLGILDLRSRRPGLSGLSGDLSPLIWTLPWGGRADEGIALQRVDPLCIEICRRVRLFRPDPDRRDALAAATAKTAKPRMLAALSREGLAGDVGDPWIPVARKTRKALRPPETGIEMRLMTEVLFDPATWDPAPLQNPLTGDPDGAMTCIFRALTFGRSSVSYNEGRLRIPRQGRRLLLNPDTQGCVGRLLQGAMADARDVRNKALAPAVLTWLQDGPRQVDGARDQDADMRREIEQVYDRAVDRAVGELIAGIAGDPPHYADGVRAGWLDRLEVITNDAFDILLDRAPRNGTRAVRAGSLARGRMDAALDRLSG